MATKVDSKDWQAHLAAAQREGKSLRRYALERGLSPWSLYDARRRLREREQGAEPKSTAPQPTAEVSQFARVAVMPSPTGWAPLRVQLPNGVRFTLPIGDGDSAALVTAVRILAQLPCSA